MNPDLSRLHEHFQRMPVIGRIALAAIVIGLAGALIVVWTLAGTFLQHEKTAVFSDGSVFALSALATICLVASALGVVVLVRACRVTNGQALHTAQQIAQARSVFFASVSHEIRTPLNAIIVLLGLLLKDPMRGLQKSRLERANTAARHLLGVVNDVLDFSRLESGRVQLETRPFHLWQLLSDVAGMFEDRAMAKGLVLTVQADPAVPVLTGDPLRISQILINMVANAIQFSEAGEIVIVARLDLSDQQPTVYVEVRDQGPGLLPEKIDRVFEPFEQTDASTARRYGGSGLGLAISRSLAVLMGGQVGAQREPGSGSCFWFYVPVQYADESMISDPPLQVMPAVFSASMLRSLRILLIDDNELNRLVGEELLLEWGVRVDLADSGLDAMAKLELHPPDHYSALLIDLMMPGLDGYETTRMIRANHRFDHLPIIALSAQDDPDSLGTCVEAGMNGHVAKPLDADRLWDVLIKSVVADAGGGFVSSAAAGRKMPARPRQSSESSTAAVLFDPQPLDRLRSKVAPDRFDAMLRLLLEDCRVQVARLRQCACGGDFSALRQYAHDLCSTAGHAGMLQLGDLGRELLRGVSRSDDEMVLRIVNQIEVVAAESINVLSCYIMKEMDREALVE